MFQAYMFKHSVESARNYAYPFRLKIYIGGPYSEWVLIPMMGLFIVKCHYK